MRSPIPAKRPRPSSPTLLPRSQARSATRVRAVSLSSARAILFAISPISRWPHASGLSPRQQLGREALAIAQWTNQSSAAAAVQQLGLRFAANNDALAVLVRERQDLTALWRVRDKALIEALSKPEGQRNAPLIESIRRAGRRRPRVGLLPMPRV